MALGPFLRFLCYVLGTKLGGVLPLRMCHKAIPFVIGGLVGRTNMRNKLKQVEKSQF